MSKTWNKIKLPRPATAFFCRWVCCGFAAGSRQPVLRVWVSRGSHNPWQSLVVNSFFHSFPPHHSSLVSLIIYCSIRFYPYSLNPDYLLYYFWCHVSFISQIAKFFYYNTRNTKDIFLNIAIYVCAGSTSKMMTKKTAEKKITTPSTCLQKTQTVILRKSGAIGKPGEEFSLHLSWGQFTLTRHAVSGLIWWSSDCVSRASNTGVRGSCWLVASVLVSCIACSMKSSFTIEIISLSALSTVMVIVVTVIKWIW